MPEAVGTVVAVAPGSLIVLFYGVCVTVPNVPIFEVTPACSFCVPSMAIV